MKKFILFVFFFSWFHQYGQIIEVAHGKLELYKDFPSQYVKPRDIAVWLPENYSQKKRIGTLCTRRIATSTNFKSKPNRR